MAHSAETILKALKKSSYKPFYFIQGEETYYIDAMIKYMETSILTPMEQSFNLTIFYGMECNMVTLLTQARRFPMGASKQVVVVKEAQEMADLKNNTGQRLLLDYVNHPQPTTLLAFAYKYKTIDGRSAFGKALAMKEVLVTSNKLYDRQLPDFIHAFVAEIGLSITEEAVWMIQAYMDTDLSKIASELQKLRINLAQGTEITSAMVIHYIGSHKPFNVFALQNAVMKKDYPKSYTIMSHAVFSLKDQSAFIIIAVLYGLFSKLLLLHESKALTPAKAAQVIKVPPYFVQDYLHALKQYALSQILKNITYLYEADLQLKGVECSMTDDQILKELIFKLMHDVEDIL